MYDYPTYFEEIPDKKLWDMININVGTTTLMTKLVIKQMRKRRKGAIINISSASELQPMPLMTVYSATKIYIKSFSEAIRAEYSQFGISVQHLSPFYITTKMNAYSHHLQVSNMFIPDATTYAKNAIVTLSKMDTITGYWAHSIQKLFILIMPKFCRIEFARKTFVKSASFKMSEDGAESAD
ncbi:hypothetical protein HN011_005320 [Eciton burchellii]|nr:hypothetical protein HN011_005320 [Eciton burchellii]